MRENIKIRQQQENRVPYYEDADANFVFGSDSKDFMYTRSEVKHTMKMAKTKQLNTTTTSNNQNPNDDGFYRNEHFNDTSIKNNNNNKKRKGSIRKNSITRLSNAFRDLQHTMTPRKIKHRKTIDCNFNEQIIISPGFPTKKSVERSLSLPDIKDNNKKNGKRKSVFRKLSHSHRNAHIKHSPDFESDIIAFPSNRLEAYRTRSTDSILQSEIDRINKRRQQGRSTSAQFTSNRDNTRDLKSRDRSLSTDCDEHLFSFDALVARRLNSSKETQLCSTDL